MTFPFHVIEGSLLPEDQAREDKIDNLARVICNRKIPLHDRHIAWDEMTKLIEERPAYVVHLMEKEQGIH